MPRGLGGISNVVSVPTEYTPARAKGPSLRDAYNLLHEIGESDYVSLSPGKQARPCLGAVRGARAGPVVVPSGKGSRAVGARVAGQGNGTIGQTLYPFPPCLVTCPWPRRRVPCPWARPTGRGWHWAGRVTRVTGHGALVPGASISLPCHEGSPGSRVFSWLRVRGARNRSNDPPRPTIGEN